MVTSRVIVPNPYHDDDWTYNFKYNRWILYLTGSLTSQHSLLLRIGNTLLVVFEISCISSFLVSFILGVALNNYDMTERVKDTSILTMCIGYLVKYLLILAQRSTLRECLMQMEIDWKNIIRDTRPIMLKNARIARNTMIGCFNLMMFAVLSWQILSFTKKPVMINNEPHYDLPYAADFVYFNSRVKPFYYYVRLHQFVAIFFITCIITNSFTAVTCALHACSQFEGLVYAIHRITEGWPGSLDESKDSQLAKVVKKHNEVMRFANKIDRVFKWTFLVEWFECIILICFISYFMVTDSNPGLLGFIKNISSILTISVLFYVLCIMGEEIMQQSINVGNSIYECNWVDLSKNQKCILMMINITKTFPKMLTAGKFILLQMESFSEVVKKSMAFFSLIRNVV